MAVLVVVVVVVGNASAVGVDVGSLAAAVVVADYGAYSCLLVDQVDQVAADMLACTHSGVTYYSDAYLDSLDCPVVVASWPGLNDTFSDYCFRY